MIMNDPEFPKADARLRRGHHISATHDHATYHFIADHYDDLSSFYRKYECTLSHCQAATTGGAYYLAPMGERCLLGSRRLPESYTHIACILLTQSRQSDGLSDESSLTLDGVLTFLANTVTSERQQQIYVPHQRREGTNGEDRIRKAVMKVLKDLRSLECLDWDAPHGAITIREGLFRFIGPARLDHPENPVVRERLRTQEGVSFPEDHEDPSRESQDPSDMDEEGDQDLFADEESSARESDIMPDSGENQVTPRNSDQSQGEEPS